MDAAERGIRLIAYDRPGYGGSTASPGRTIAACAIDVCAIIDALGIERIGVWGISGGAPHALACAALLPDRVVAAASLASSAPFDAAGLDWFAGQAKDNLDDWQLMLSNPEAARAKLARDREALMSAIPPDESEMYPTVFSATDAAALTPELAGYYAARGRDGLAPGIEGWWEDSVAMLTPWGFDPEEIRVPIMLWHGREDRFVPFQHGQWLASRIPAVHAELTDDDGHLTLLQTGCRPYTRGCWRTSELTRHAAPASGPLRSSRDSDDLARAGQSVAQADRAETARFKTTAGVCSSGVRIEPLPTLAGYAVDTVDIHDEPAVGDRACDRRLGAVEPQLMEQLLANHSVRVGRYQSQHIEIARGSHASIVTRDLGERSIAEPVCRALSQR
jgi:pimeloyl-ACP methyl ester carboxylesterase